MTEKGSIYKVGNSWQKKVYKKMSQYLDAIPEVKDFGTSRSGKKYKHLLKMEDAKHNFITDEIYNGTKERFQNHRAGDLKRVLTNTAASQAYCFNLVIHLNNNKELANALFSELLNKKVSVVHIEPEFTPNMCDEVKGYERDSDESIGDQNLRAGYGTDADIAVFYSYEDNKKGVILIEFKFIEAEFSVCSSYRKKRDIKATCDSKDYFSLLVDSNDLKCGYNKYLNWDLTRSSMLFNHDKISSLDNCPFRSGLNQLWRNLLLAEQVSKARNLDEFHFWVFSPTENFNYLWDNGKIEDELRGILTKKGQVSFRSITLESILDRLSIHIINRNDKNWLDELNKKYRIQ